MARQAINVGFPNPNYVNETGIRQAILPGVYFNDTSTPFSNPTQQNPAGTVRSIVLLTWLGAALTTTLATQSPFNPPDLPNPAAARRPVDLLTWTNPGLEVGDVPIPFANYDWPNPRAPLRQALTWTNAGLETGDIPAPFATYDWPNPQVAVRQALTWTNPGLEVGDVPIPFATYDWPNPRGATRQLDLGWSQGLITAEEPTPFFVHLDWPNPRGPAWPIALLTWLNPANIAPPPVSIVRDIDVTLTKEQLEALRRKLKSKRKPNDWSREIEDRKSVRRTLEAFFKVADKEGLDAVVAEMPVVPSKPAPEPQRQAKAPTVAPYVPSAPEIDWRALEASRQAMERVVTAIDTYMRDMEVKRKAEAERKAWEEADEEDVEFLLTMV